MTAAGEAGRRRLVPLALYHAIFLLFGAALAPVVLWRAVVDRRYRAALVERTGRVPASGSARQVVWVHGVSVGEIKGLGRLVDEIQAAHPDVEIVVSATTRTGFELACRLHPQRRVIRYPIDFGTFPGRALDRIRPVCVLLMELEVWPNFLRAAQRRQVPVLVVNGRISERSFRGYRRVRGMLPQFEWIARFCVQTDVYRDRLLALGVEPHRIVVTGNMKYDSVPLRGAPAGSARLRDWLAADGRLVVVCGSTHGREDEWLAAAVTRTAARLGRPLRFVTVPRHPVRAPAVVEALAAAGREVIRWSDVEGRDSWPSLADDAAVVVDTIGHLEAFYGACDLAFVGGSLVSRGGQNMLEPAALGKPVAFGPEVANFRADVELLLASDAAVQVPGVAALDDALFALLSDPERRRALGERAVALIRANQGATERTLAAIEPVLSRSLGADRPRTGDS